MRIVSDRDLDTLDNIPGDFGRRIETQTNLAAGDLVLKSSASAIVLSPEFWSSRCHKCFASDVRLSFCGRCRTAFYCMSAISYNLLFSNKYVYILLLVITGSKSCQQADWVRDHRKECKRLAQLMQLGLRSDQVAQVLLLGRVLRCNMSEGVLPSELVWYEEDMDDHELLLLAALTQKINLVDDSFSMDEMVRMFSRFRNNNFSICDDLLLEVGVGCYPLAAMINHSCDPNCVVTFDSKTLELEVRAMKFIQSGEEITQTYVDVALPRRERHQRLQKKYHFTCRCPRCTLQLQEAGSLDAFLDADINGIPQDGWTKQRQKEVEQALQEVSDATNGVGIDTDVATQQQQCINALKQLAERQSTLLHQNNTARLQTLSALFSAHMERGSFEEAIGYGERILKFYRRVYNSNHPMTGLHLFTLGDLYGQQVQLGMRTAESKTKGAAYLAEAQRILCITHGKNHRFVKMLADRLKNLSP
ncbi:putative SET domain, tetratricopeptide-like helical domain superfamily [Plasmopara halstedii]